MNRTMFRLWVELDSIVQFGLTQGIPLLEDELIADAHSHPHRSNTNDTSTAISRAWAEVLRASKAKADVVHNGDAKPGPGTNGSACV